MEKFRAFSLKHSFYFSRVRYPTTFPYWTFNITITHIIRVAYIMPFIFANKKLHAGSKTEKIRGNYENGKS